MKKAKTPVYENVTAKKKVGRPATGQDPAITTRLPPDVLAKVEIWAAGKGVPRSQAIARLVARGLDAEGATARPARAIPPKAKPVRKATAPKRRG